MSNGYTNSEIEDMLMALKAKNSITTNKALDTIKKVHTEDPNLTHLRLINRLMDLLKDGTENIDQVCNIAGMLMIYENEPLRADQMIFVDFFMDYAIRFSYSVDNAFGTLIYGLSYFDLSKYVEFLTKVAISGNQYQAFNVIDAFKNIDYKKVSKKIIEECLQKFRAYRRANGFNYIHNNWEFDIAIKALQMGLIGNSYKRAY